MRKSSVFWEYSACVIWKCGRHDTHQGTHYAAIIQAQGLNVTELLLIESRICSQKQGMTAAIHSQAAVNQK